MSTFTQYTDKNAPEGAAEVLATVKDRYGFIPNLAAYVAEAPGVLGAVMNMAEAFDNTSLTPQEQQIVLLTVSTLNGCSYCKTVHTALGNKAEVDAETLKAVIELAPLADKKLNALRNFTHKLVEEKGWVNEKGVQEFLDAGYSRAQVFEVVLGIAMKTMTNYSNHLAGAEPNPEFVNMAGSLAAA